MSIEKNVRRWVIIVMGALLLALVSGCALFNQAPVAHIASSVLSGNSPLIVAFDANQSEDADGTITAYKWDFGDDNTATGVMVQHTFSSTDAIRIFKVTLTVTDNIGTTSQATQTIEVHPNGNGAQPPENGTGMPTARFTVTRFIGVNPLTVTFDATGSTPGSGSIVAYNWDFAGGKTATGLRVTHTFTPDPKVTTTYPVTLYVWNSNRQLDTEQLDIIVIVPAQEPEGHEPPVADISVTGPRMIFQSDRPDIPSLFEVKFDPRGSYADAGRRIDYYAWDFGDGARQVNTSNLEVTHIYELRGRSRTLVAQLTVFDDQGLENTVKVNITLTTD